MPNDDETKILCTYILDLLKEEVEQHNQDPGILKNRRVGQNNLAPPKSVKKVRFQDYIEGD